MSGDRFDDSSERQRHEKLVGRPGLLARLDQLLVDSDVNRWVVITGSPGMARARCSWHGWRGAWWPARYRITSFVEARTTGTIPGSWSARSAKAEDTWVD